MAPGPFELIRQMETAIKARTAAEEQAAGHPAPAATARLDAAQAAEREAERAIYAQLIDGPEAGA